MRWPRRVAAQPYSVVAHGGLGCLPLARDNAHRVPAPSPRAQLLPWRARAGASSRLLHPVWCEAPRVGRSLPATPSTASPSWRWSILLGDRSPGSAPDDG